jgi:anti-sigma28 factor (negative regulator of flagellin synthesis)
MTLQIFALTCVFHPQRRHGNRNVPRQFMIQSSSEAEDYLAVTSQRLQPSAYLSGPDAQSRADKIAQLRDAVESGAYCVSAEQIAEKIAQQILADLFT